MGLDTTHDAWHGAYSAFGRWRRAIAEAAGYETTEPFGSAKLDWDQFTDKNLEGKWEKTPEDPLLVLLVHYDCEGSIYPEQAKPLADRLEGLLPKLDGDLGGHVGNLKEKTEQFIKGLREAVDTNEPVEFH